MKLSLYDVEVGAPTPGRTRKEAETIGEAIKRAVWIADARYLDPVEREVCLRIFENRGWDILPGLIFETVTPSQEPQEPLLVDAIKMALFSSLPYASPTEVSGLGPPIDRLSFF